MIVTAQHTAIALGSGDLPVFATPAMVSLMESAAMVVASGFCSPEQTTVGTLINVQHTRASAIGANVTAEARLLEQEGRRLIFEISASDDKGEIGSGRHERFIVDRAKFMSRL